MIMNITSFLSNIDKNSQFLLIIIGVISSLLLLTFVINYFNSRKARKILKKQRKYKKKLMEEINSEANNITFLSDSLSLLYSGFWTPGQFFEDKNSFNLLFTKLIAVVLIKLLIKIPIWSLKLEKNKSLIFSIVSNKSSSSSPPSFTSNKI